MLRKLFRAIRRALGVAPTVTTLGLSDASTQLWQGGVAVSSARAGEAVDVLAIDRAEEMHARHAFLRWTKDEGGIYSHREVPLGSAVGRFVAAERLTPGDLVEIETTTRHARLVRSRLSAWQQHRRVSAPEHEPQIRVTTDERGATTWTESFR